MSEESNHTNKRLLNRAYKYMAGIFVFFFITAIVSSVIGDVIDDKFGIRPLGSIGTFLVVYIISWITVKVILNKLTKK